MVENTEGSSSNTGGITEPLLKSDFNGSSKHDPEYNRTKLVHSLPSFATNFGYNHGHRPCRDVSLAVIFLLVTLCTFAFGIFAIVHHNSDYQWVEPPHYVRNETRCIIPGKSPGLGSSLHVGSVMHGTWWTSKLQTDSWRPYTSLILPQRLATSDVFLVSVISSLVVTLVLSVPLVLLLIWLFRSFTKELVYVSLPLVVLFPVALNILWFVVCEKETECRDSLSLSVRIIFLVLIFLVCAVVIWIIFANFARIELTVRVITTAAEALYRNLSLLLVVPGLSLLLLLFYVPAGFFFVFAYMNGKYTPNSELKERPELPCGRGTNRDCCIWSIESWVPAYMTLAALWVLWTSFVVAQIKVFTISGTISQWYFAEDHTQTLGALKKSLGQAFSSSFGTICFTGLVFAFIRLIRNAVDTATSNQEREGGVALSCLRCCYDCMLRAFEFITKFTLDYAAITGESFCESARQTYDLLKRNILSTVVVEVISTRLLGSVVFVSSVVYAVALWGVLRGTTSLGNDIYIVTGVSLLLLLLVLSVFIAVMNIIVDTVYICYAMDKDRGVVSKPEAHEVYVLLPVSQDERTSLAVRDMKDSQV